MRPFRRRGIALVWVAILLVPLIAVVGLAVDWGYIYWNNQKLQNAADAAALAGAQRLMVGNSAARLAAVDLAAANEVGGKPVLLAPNSGNEAGGDIVLGIFDKTGQTFTRTTASPNAVKITARRHDDSLSGALPIFFGQLFGFNTVEMACSAIAIAEGDANYPPIIALNDRDPESFYLYGSGTLDVGSGTVQVNSSNIRGARVQGAQGVKFYAGEMNIVGGYQRTGNPKQVPDSINEQQPYLADPLADLPEPEPGPPMTPSGITSAGEYQAGYYPQGLNLNGGEVFLHPGVYILDNGFRVNGKVELTGHGVMFFIRTGQVFENGTGEVHLTPPTEGTYAGISFFQARSNTTTAEFNGRGLMTGTGPDDTNGTGTFYFPNAKLRIGGHGEMYINKLIADKIEIYGTGLVKVTDGWGSGGIGSVVYLVR